MSGLTLLRPGTVFASDYRVVQPLREGGMGAVYVVEQISTSERRALKVMLPSLVDNQEARRRFEREAKIGSLIKSDFVVKVIQAGVDAGTGMPWLAMELLEGEELEHYAERKGRLSAEETLEVFDQLCDALGKAHQAGIVHRDLKPENIFMALPRRRREKFMVKVLDFGIARMLAEAQTTQAKTRGVVGTPLFMAPEQATPGGIVSPASDVWALGLIAFRVLTGRHFWRTAYEASPTLMMLAMEAFMQPTPPASSRAAQWGCPETLPPGFDAWFSRCLQKDAAHRFADAGAVFAALEPVLSAAKGPVAPAPTTTAHATTAAPVFQSNPTLPTPPQQQAPVFQSNPTLPTPPQQQAPVFQSNPQLPIAGATMPGGAPPVVAGPIQTTALGWPSGSTTGTPLSGAQGRGKSGALFAVIGVVVVGAAIGGIVWKTRQNGLADTGTAPTGTTSSGATGTALTTSSTDSPAPTSTTSSTDSASSSSSSTETPSKTLVTTSTSSATKTTTTTPTSMPTGGDEVAIRKALEPKVWSGKATISEVRMLKAICAHMGDRACRDKAAAILKKMESAPAPGPNSL